MICRRRNLGTLQVNFAPPTPQGLASSAIDSVPDEVWQLVKQQVTALAAQDTRQAFLQAFRDRCGDDSQSPHPHTDSLQECIGCLDEFEYEHDLHEYISPASKVSLVQPRRRAVLSAIAASRLRALFISRTGH